jgi:L-alanine-DL-glutamate epimerase-like enolase superfamily enzyme
MLPMIFPQVCKEEGGLKISKIETFTGFNPTFVKVTTNDGFFGFGQGANCNNNIKATVLHQMIASLKV